jgi:hypothetical protein
MEVRALSSLFGELLMMLTELYGPKLITESRILQRGRMRSEKLVARTESFILRLLRDA